MHNRVPIAEFVVSALSERDFPRDGLPEIVIAGRSNVGKSSLINRLVKNNKLARTSSTPGKTQSINFYRLRGAFFLVDLPGFGYARAGKAASRQWKKCVENYFRNRTTIALVLHLIDARMAPTPLDLELANWLKQLGIARMNVATKADKLSGNGQVTQLRIISDALGGEPVTLSSALTGMGCNEIWNRIVDSIRRP
jgi:GTP-binding protein